MSDNFDAKGEIVFFNNTGGYGFVETDEIDEDVFFHLEDFEGRNEDFEEGDMVRFNIEAADKGPRATDMEEDDEE